MEKVGRERERRKGEDMGEDRRFFSPTGFPARPDELWEHPVLMMRVSVIGGEKTPPYLLVDRSSTLIH